MWKFLLAVAAVVGLVAVQHVSITIPHIPYALMSLPAVCVVFAAGMYLSQR
ncbi:MAG: hypothetical protein AB7U75_13405 [Hyphomicrobiaceae bacterium]